MMKWGLVSLLSTAVSGQAMAAFVLNGTRFIYEEGRKNTSFEVTNRADETFGGGVDRQHHPGQQYGVYGTGAAVL